MNFFCTKKEYDTWVAKMQLNEFDIFCLNVEEALRVSEMLFSVTDI
ncbi:alkylmercury lyase family protein [Tissierella sp. MSJ-40]|nr:alkylmercury lyase family protein [Tissierella simiarum]